MKKTIIFIFSLVILFTFVSCSQSISKGEKGTLIIDGKSINSNTTVYSEYATLSLCDVISALGLELTWNDEDNATFYCNDIRYNISISQKTLFREGDKDNYLLPAPGCNGEYVCDYVDGELIVDNIMLTSLFCSFIKYPIDIDINWRDNSVIIESK